MINSQEEVEKKLNKFKSQMAYFNSVGFTNLGKDFQDAVEVVEYLQRKIVELNLKIPKD